jgi:hypothetical protein
MVCSPVIVRLRVAWWLRWYLSGVILTSWLTGLAPDLSKVGEWIRRAVRVDAIGRPRRRTR